MTIAYICNCKKECNSGCGCILNGGECSHTTDISFAKNYDEVPLVTEDSNFINVSDPYNGSRYFEEESNGCN